jgi:hypothetical protein
MLAAARLEARSPLFQWLHQHHDQIADWFASQSRPGWEVIARTARANGVVNANGHPPNRGAVRKAWTTLQADLKRAPSRPTERQPAAMPRQRKPLVLRTARPARSRRTT